jgi:hypothetical protein
MTSTVFLFDGDSTIWLSGDVDLSNARTLAGLLTEFKGGELLMTAPRWSSPASPRSQWSTSGSAMRVVGFGSSRPAMRSNASCWPSGTPSGWSADHAWTVAKPPPNRQDMNTLLKGNQRARFDAARCT